MAYRASVYKSIQRGTVTLNNALSGTATLNPAVDMDYATVSLLGYGASSNDQNAEKFVPDIAITNSGTKVTVTLNTVLAVNNVVPYEVREYWQNELLQPVQRGTIDTSASHTATITAVGAKAFTSRNGATNAINSGSFGAFTPFWPAVVLTNATTLTATVLNGLDYVARYEVIDPR